MRRILDGLRHLAAWEWLTVPLAAPLLLFPTVRPSWTAAVLVILILGWLARWLLRREFWPRTPLNRPLLLLALMIPVGIWASPLPELTLPKATGLVLGLAAFRAVVLAVRDRRALQAALAVLLLLSLGFIAVGVVTTDWASKVPFLADVTRRLPRLIATLPDLRAAGIHPNMIAGILALCLPVFPVLAVGTGRRLPALLARLSLGVLLLVLTGLLALTQSRGGWVGVAAGWLALGVLWGLSGQRRWARVAAVAVPALIVVVVIAAVLAVGPSQLWEMVVEAGGDQSVEAVVGSISVAGRIEIWNRALYVIRDMPFTGCGLGTFREVVRAFYPLFLTAPDYDIAHAHNIFLQMAVDLGLPGLLAYLWLLAAAGAVCWRLARRGDSLVRPAALGLAAGLTGLHVYGLADALALGSKPGLLFWVALALVAALGQAEEKRLPGLKDLGRLADWKRLAGCLSGSGAPCPDDAADAERLVALAEKLQLTPLLYRRLRDAHQPLPPEAEARLVRAYWTTRLHNEARAAAVAAIGRAFADQGVSAILLKGLALVGLAYPDVGIRVMGDIDLLVRPADVDRASMLLEQLGYAPVAAQQADRPADFMMRYDGEQAFNGAGGAVELHWCLVNYDWFRDASAISLDALWQRAVPLDESGVLRLSPEDTLLHLCLHLGIHHAYGVARMLVDVDQLVRCQQGLDWEALLERARAFRLQSALYFGLDIARRLLGTPIPPHVLDRLQPPPWICRVVERLVDPLARIPCGEQGGGPQSLRFLHFLLVDRWQDRWTGLARLFFPGHDWIAARYAADTVQKKLLYGIIHPVRMLWLLILALTQLVAR